MPISNPQTLLAAQMAMSAGPGVGDFVRASLDRVRDVLPSDFVVPAGTFTVAATVVDRFGPVGSGRVYTVRIGGDGDTSVIVSLEESYVSP